MNEIIAYIVILINSSENVLQKSLIKIFFVKNPLFRY
jgi:hypothetical protein